MKDQFGMIEKLPIAKQGSIATYTIGFILSLLLTLSAYFLVAERVFANWVLISIISGLAILQMIVQLVFFLHLDSEKKPRWNLLSFLFMTLVIVILVAGSLWIMYSLDNRVMPVVNPNLLHERG